MATSIEGQAGAEGVEAPPPPMGALVEIRQRTVERTQRFDTALKAYGDAVVDFEANPGDVRDVAQAVRSVADEWLALVEEREMALELQPATLEQALDAMWQAQATYDAAMTAAIASRGRWSEMDVIGSRVRRSAVKRLQEGGMSATAADKAASDDESYAAHKDRVARLLDSKLDDEATRDDALERLLSARATVEAMTAREQSRSAETMRAVRDWALGGKAPF